jgi:hypothetical protein
MSGSLHIFANRYVDQYTQLQALRQIAYSGSSILKQEKDFSAPEAS